MSRAMLGRLQVVRKLMIGFIFFSQATLVLRTSIVDQSAKWVTMTDVQETVRLLPYCNNIEQIARPQLRVYTKNSQFSHASTIICIAERLSARQLSWSLHITQYRYTYYVYRNCCGFCTPRLPQLGDSVFVSSQYDFVMSLYCKPQGK